MACPMCQREHPYTIAEALAQLASTPKRLERLAAGLSSKRAGARPAPDKWSAKEIVSHLADCDLVHGFRYRKIMAEPGSLLPAFDQNAWADNLRYQDQSLKTALACFCGVRTGNLALLKSVPEEKWDQGGTHAEYGTLTLRQLVLHLADHDKNHIAQVERLCPPPAAPRIKEVPRKRGTKARAKRRR